MTDDFFQSDLSFLGEIATQPRAATATRPSRGVSHNIAGLTYSFTRSEKVCAKISATNRAKGIRPPHNPGRKQSTHAREAIAQSNQVRWHSTDPKWVAWREQQAQALAARTAAKRKARGPSKAINATRVDKVFYTPFGEFANAAEAVEYLRLAGVPNWRRWMHAQQTQHPKKYYFIRKRVPK
jgi:hypothetical protein